jgi:hypothetical protein
MSIAPELQHDNVACFENPNAASGSSVAIRPPGAKYRYLVQDIPDRGSITWLFPARKMVEGVEGIYLVIATPNTESDTTNGLSEDTSYFLRTVYFLDATGHNRDAADIAIDKLDDLLNAGEFYKCNCILRAASANDMSDLLIVTFLGITLGAKELLAARPAFFARAHEVVSKRRGRDGADSLLNKYR